MPDRTKATPAGADGRVDGRACCGPTSSPGTSTSCASRPGEWAARGSRTTGRCAGTCPHGTLVRQPGPAAPDLLAHRRARQPSAAGRAGRVRSWSSRGCAPAALRRRDPRLGPRRGRALPPRRPRRAHRPAGVGVDRPVGRRRPRCCRPPCEPRSPTPSSPASGRRWAERGRARAGCAWATGPPTRATTSCSSVVADMLADRSLLTVGEVADRHAVTVRTLQRLVHALRGGRAEVGARALPHARRRGRARRRVRGHAHRPRGCATAGTTRRTSPGTSPRSSGCRRTPTAAGVWRDDSGRRRGPSRRSKKNDWRCRTARLADVVGQVEAGRLAEGPLAWRAPGSRTRR